MLLLLAFVSSAQEDTKLTKLQKQHLQMYVVTQKALRSERPNHKKIFSAYYAFIANSNKQMYPINQRNAAAHLEKAQRALAENKKVLVEKHRVAATYFDAMAKKNENIVTAFEKMNINKLQELVGNYIELEKQMQSLGLTPLPREWFSTQEARLIIKQQQAKR